jgi:hypothetical protein
MEDLREQIRKHDSARYFALEGLKGLLDIIQQTRPDNVLGLSKSATKTTSEELYNLSGIDLKEWNTDWVKNAREMITSIWNASRFLANDIANVMKEITDSTTNTNANKPTP